MMILIMNIKRIDFIVNINDIDVLKMIDDQEILFKLLNPTPDIGVELTEGFMMDPEASVSAICFHHPKATYFSVGNQAEFN